MKNLIERYIYDVVRRLPENEQEDVGKELRSNIYDMLPEDPTDGDVAAILNQLGAPALMAEQYRQNPRCLISSAFYDDYIRTLKWVLPLVGCILMVIGLLQSGIEATKGGMDNFQNIISAIISGGLSSGISGAIQALVWVTAGFAIADRVSNKTNAACKWSIKDLPDDIPTSTKTIPLSDSIVELIIIVFFSTIGVLLCVKQIPFPFLLRHGNIEIQSLFSNSFLTACIPVIIIGGVLGVCESLAKIIQRRWSPLVCATVIISNLTGIGMLLYLSSLQDILSPDLLHFVETQGWMWFDRASALNNTIVMLVLSIVIVASLAECGVVIYRTVKAIKAR